MPSEVCPRYYHTSDVFVVAAGHHGQRTGEPTTPTPDLSSEYCQLDADYGLQCRANNETAWFYNRSSGQCETFTFGGCLGNQNRFLSRAICRSVCVLPAATSRRPPPPHASSLPPPGMPPINQSINQFITAKSQYTHTHTHARTHARTHTHTRLTALCPGLPRVSRYQKGKTNLDFTEARDGEWQWHQLGHMQVCTWVQTDNHTSTPPLSFLRAGCPSAAKPTASKH